MALTLPSTTYFRTMIIKVERTKPTATTLKNLYDTINKFDLKGVYYKDGEIKRLKEKSNIITQERNN